MPLWRNVKQANRVGTKQPLVVRGNGEIGLDILHAKRKCAEGLRQIEGQRSTELATSLADADEIEQPAACPVDIWEGGDGHVGGQRMENGCGPVMVFGPGDDFQ